MFLAVVVVFIALPVYMLFIRDDDDGPSSSDVNAALTDPSKASAVLVGNVGDQKQGITIRFPRNWKSESENDAVRAKSANGKTVVVVTTGGRADQAPDIFKKTVQGIGTSYEKPTFKFIPAKEQPAIGGRPAAGAAVSGQLKDGPGATSFVYVVRGKERAYIVTAIVPNDGGELNTANLIVTRGLTLSD